MRGAFAFCTVLLALLAAPAGADLKRDHVGNLMPFGQSGSAIFGFPATATNAANLQRTGLALLLAALLLLTMPSLQRSFRHGQQA